MAEGTYALNTTANLKTWLNITSTEFDTILDNLVNATTARIERYIGRQIKARDRIEFHDGNTRTLRLKQYPVNSCRFVGYGRETALIVTADPNAADLSATVQVTETAIRTVRNQSTGQTNTTADYDFGSASPSYTMTSSLQPIIDAATGFNCTLVINAPLRYLHRTGAQDVVNGPAYLTYPSSRSNTHRIDLDTGLVTMPVGWRCDDWEEDDEDHWIDSRQTVVIDYNAGYSTVPDDIAQATLEIAAAAYRARFKDANVNSESLGDYSYTSAVREAADDMLDSLLSAWKEIR